MEGLEGHIQSCILTPKELDTYHRVIHRFTMTGLGFALRKTTVATGWRADWSSAGVDTACPNQTNYEALRHSGPGRR